MEPRVTSVSLLARLRSKLGRFRVALVFGVIYAVSQWTILRIIEPLGSLNVLSLQTAMTPEAFLAIKQSWVEAGVMGAYWRHFYPDFAHPFWYGTFLAACIAAALDYARRPSSYDFLVVLPYVAGAADLVENSMHVMFLLRPETIVQPWVAISGAFTHLKWGLLCALLLVLGLVVGGLRKRRLAGD